MSSLGAIRGIMTLTQAHACALGGRVGGCVYWLTVVIFNPCVQEGFFCSVLTPHEKRGFSVFLFSFDPSKVEGFFFSVFQF
jgi:hypothetical protein